MMYDTEFIRKDNTSHRLRLLFSPWASSMYSTGITISSSRIMMGLYGAMERYVFSHRYRKLMMGFVTTFTRRTSKYPTHFFPKKKTATASSSRMVNNSANPIEIKTGMASLCILLFYCHYNGDNNTSKNKAEQAEDED